jgi:hypothetical protein
VDRGLLDRWPAARREELTLRVAERMLRNTRATRKLWPDPGRNPARTLSEKLNEFDLQDMALRRLFAMLAFDSGWPASAEALEAVLRSIALSKSGHALGPAELLRCVARVGARFRPSAEARVALADKLGSELWGWGRGTKFEDDGQRQLIANAQRALGHAPLAFDPTFPANALMLADLGTDAPRAWTDLIDQCATCPASRPPAAWRTAAAGLLAEVDQPRFERLAARWLAALSEPIDPHFGRGDWAIPEREEAWLAGLAWCVALRPGPTLIAAVAGAVRQAMRKHEYGQRSRALAISCIDALAHADHPSALKALKALERTIKHAVVKKNVSKAVAQRSLASRRVGNGR